MRFFAVAVAMVQAVTPVQKVLSMLSDMQAKGQAEMEVEAETFDKYEDWKVDQVRTTGFQIEDTSAKIETLKADVAKADATSAELGAAITALEGEIANAQKELADATALRNKEKDEYEALHADYSESFDALDRAIQVMKSQAYDRKQATALLQGMAAKTQGARRVLAAFLQGYEQPEADGYEFQSGGIVSMLKGLKTKFRDELRAVEKSEANAQHAYDLMAMNLNDQIENDTADRDEKSTRRASTDKQSAEWKGQLADAQADLAADQKYLSDVKATFTQKSRDFAANQQTRKDEIAAIAKAIEIISGQAVKGAAEEHLPSLAQRSFVQLRASSAAQKQIIKNAVQFLEERATKMNSKVLSLVALHAAADPFAKVTKMIRDLLARLEEEAASEADHKAFCDKELHKNKNTREAKTAAVNKLHATIDELNAVVAKLGSEIATLSDEEAALNKAMQEATEVRNKENAANTKTVADAKTAQEAVTSALTVLKEFYASAAFLQQVPEMARYSGQQSSSKGVVGMLEVIGSDFARLEAETSSTEAQAQQAYDEFMGDSKASAEAKHKEGFDKSMLKDRKEHERHLNEKDLSATQKELDAALEYYESLKPQCLEVHVSYEERKRMREEEIASLQQAYEMLGGVAA